MQNIITVAIQGDRASFHEIAAKKYYSQSIKFYYCQTFGQVFEALHTGQVHYAFAAIENSAYGELHEVQELLRSYRPLQQGMHRERIRQHVVGLPGATIADINEIVSHPVALSQCDRYIEEHLPGVRLMQYHDTAAAIGLVKQGNDRSRAAIGSAEAAELYGMQVIAYDVQTDPDNHTTFVSLVAQKDT